MNLPANGNKNGDMQHLPSDDCSSRLTGFVIPRRMLRTCPSFVAAAMLITAISAFQVFDIVFVLTRGGPADHTMIMSILMYQNAFEFDKVGYGSAIAVLLGLIVLAMSVVFLRVRGVLGKEIE